MITVGSRQERKPSETLTIDTLARLLGVDTPNDWENKREGAFDGCWDSSLTDEENDAAEREARNEGFSRYVNAIVAVSERLFEHHSLNLVETKSRKYGTRYRVAPTRTWGIALANVVTTINGVGLFKFGSPRDLLASGPYVSAKQGVLHHLGWIPSWAEVYGNGKANRMVDRELRY